MAFTEAQRATIRLYLGWPARFRSTHNELEQAMTAVGEVAEDSANLLAILPKIAAIDTRLASAMGGSKVDQAGSIILKADNGTSILRREGRRLVRQLSAILACPAGSDFFGTGRGVMGNNYVGP